MFFDMPCVDGLRHSSWRQKATRKNFYMLRIFTRPVPLAWLLALCTFIPVVTAAVLVVQIPLGALPADALRLTAAPVMYFLHALGGVVFGVLGPVQLVSALRHRFGFLHRLSGRVFVLAGWTMALAGLGLLWQVESVATALLDVARGVFSLALMVLLALGVMAARKRNMGQHRAWMVRAYVTGMGTGPVALVMFPIYLMTGKPLQGLLSDTVVVGMWLITIATGEWVIRRRAVQKPLQPIVA
ncbi:MAG: DUF2306 domain-containing protein [Hydrogenophaga sp.]|nr:DUF2306 domain-containing protein [Hydrogenophaga sp.]